MNKWAIFVFRNDLRLNDNVAFIKAAEKYAGYIIPLYIYDTKQIGLKAKSRLLKLPKASTFKCKFLIESVNDLKDQLISHKSNLIIRTGTFANETIKLAKEYNINDIFMTEETCSEELYEDSMIEKANLTVHKIWNSTLVHIDDLPYEANQLPGTYTQFRKSVEADWKVRPLYKLANNLLKTLPNNINVGISPTVLELCGYEHKFDSRSVLNFIGGSKSAYNRIQDYFFDKDCLKEYKETRNGMVGANYSTKLSPWLANGSISAKEIYYKVQEYEQHRIANKSTYWVTFELLWRDYLKFLPLKVGDKLFYLTGPNNKKKNGLRLM